jgi:hypothetical protein
VLRLRALRSTSLWETLGDTLQVTDPPPVNTPEPFTWLLLVAGIACMLTYATTTPDRWRPETDG